jgi:hypothetical protein
MITRKHGIPNQVRQGDVFLDPLPTPVSPSAIPAPTEDNRVVLAHGEVTGHAHAVYDPSSVALLSEGDGTFLVGKKDADLRHEEHAPVPVKEGVGYEVIIQREYREQEVRRVLD